MPPTSGVSPWSPSGSCAASPSTPARSARPARAPGSRSATCSGGGASWCRWCWWRSGSACSWAGATTPTDHVADDGRARREPARAVIGGTLVLLAVTGLAALAGGSPALRASTHQLSSAGGLDRGRHHRPARARPRRIRCGRRAPGRRRRRRPGLHRGVRPHGGHGLRPRRPVADRRRTGGPGGRRGGRAGRRAHRPVRSGPRRGPSAVHGRRGARGRAGRPTGRRVRAGRPPGRRSRTTGSTSRSCSRRRRRGPARASSSRCGWAPRRGTGRSRPPSC